jgi:hypothetical protein
MELEPDEPQIDDDAALRCAAYPVKEGRDEKQSLTVPLQG